MLRSPLVWLALVLGTLALYWPVLSHDFLDPTDAVCVSANAHIQAGLTAANRDWAFNARDGGNWQPLTWLSHMADVERHALNPRGHHLTNILLHAANCVLVFCLLLQMTRAFLPSAFIAALFACHPLQVETVAWVAQRRELLGGFFALLTLLCFGAYARRDNASASPRRATGAGSLVIHEDDGQGGGVGTTLLRALFYALALACFAAAALSNPLLLLLPFVLLLFDYWPWARLDNGQSHPQASTLILIEKFPFFAIAATAGAMQWLARSAATVGIAAADSTLPQRFALAFLREAQFVGRFFWPQQRVVIGDATESIPVVPLAIAMCGFLAITFLALVLKRKRPSFAAGWCWYLSLVVPALALAGISLRTLAPDNAGYLALLGLLIMVIATAWQVAREWAWLQVLLLILLTAGIGACVFLTSQEIRYWKDAETLLRHTLELAPDNLTAGRMLAAQLTRKGRVQEALVFTEDLARRRPENLEAQCLYGETLETFGDTPRAVAQFEAALKLNPTHARSHRALATLLTASGRPNEAIEHLTAALRAQPRDADGQYQLGVLLKLRNRNVDADAALRRAIKLQPGFAAARFELGALLLASGNAAGAREHLIVAVRENPGLTAAQENLADACRLLGDTTAAVRHYSEAVRLGANSARTHYQFAVLLDAQGKDEPAAVQYIAALELQPNNPEANFALARILRRQGRMDLCLQYLQDAVTQKPDVFDAVNLLAWIRATHPDPQYRKGSEALKFSAQAIRLATPPQMPVALDSLAAAYAEVGRFPDAVRMAEKAAASATANTNAPLTEAVNQRLKLYRASQPFQEKK